MPKPKLQSRGGEIDIKAARITVDYKEKKIIIG